MTRAPTSESETPATDVLTTTGAWAALGRLLPAVLFGVFPAVVITSMFVVAVRSGPLAIDFVNELYPEAELLLSGTNPFPGGETDYTRGSNHIWPPLAAFIVSPLVMLPSESAAVLLGILGLASLALSLWIVGVRDWRVFGVVALWPPVAGEVRAGHLTPLLCLLVAIVWRSRAGAFVTAGALGVAGGIKLFLWPLGVWLLAIGRARAALLAATVAGASLLLVLPFTRLDRYLTVVRDVAETFDQDGYSPYGFLAQLGVADELARGTSLAIGVALLVLTWRRQSLAAAVAASLVLSPIVWLDYYALAVIPLAISRPRLSAIWFVPLITWGLPLSGVATEPVSGVGRLLLAFALVFFVAIRDEREGGTPRNQARWGSRGFAPSSPR